MQFLISYYFVAHFHFSFNIYFCTLIYLSAVLEQVESIRKRMKNMKQVEFIIYYSKVIYSSS